MDQGATPAWPEPVIFSERVLRAPLGGGPDQGRGGASRSALQTERVNGQQAQSPPRCSSPRLAVPLKSEESTRQTKQREAPQTLAPSSKLQGHEQQGKSEEATDQWRLRRGDDQINGGGILEQKMTSVGKLVKSESKVESHPSVRLLVVADVPRLSETK